MNLPLRLLIALSPLVPFLSQGAVRVSFLMKAPALSETIELLRNAGCTSDALQVFKRAVERYNAAPFEFDFAKFPKAKQDFYEFGSASALVASLPHPLCDTRHAYEFNCFDTVITLGAEHLRTRLRGDEILAPILVPHNDTNGAFLISPVNTAKDAFMLAYPPWYREITDGALPGAVHDSRVPLTVALFRCYSLPIDTREDKLRDAVLDVLRASWERQDVRFPKTAEVVLCHEISLPKRLFCTAHAGFLIPRKKGYIYIEKAGGSGPFVRLDLEDRSDLLIWLSAVFKGAAKLAYTHHFATFNNKKITALEFTN